MASRPIPDCLCDGGVGFAPLAGNRQRGTSPPTPYSHIPSTAEGGNPHIRCNGINGTRRQCNIPGLRTHECCAPDEPQL